LGDGAERSRTSNRVQKLLEGANIKLAAVASDILGVSGRHMLEALVAGKANPAEMAELARGRLRAKIPTLQAALTGVVGAHQRFLLAQQLAHIGPAGASEPKPTVLKPKISLKP